MKLFSKLVVALFLLVSTISNAQCYTTVTILDADTGQVYQEITNGPNGTVRENCVPSGEPRLRLKITSSCAECGPAHFDGTAIHGGMATVVPGTAVYNGIYIVEFQVDNPTGTNFTLWGTQGNCDHLKMAVTYCNDDDGGGDDDDDDEICMTCPDCPNCPVIKDECLSYDIIKCCDMSCIKFKLRDKKCSGCYLVSVLLEDGSIETINMNLTDGESTMNCYNKKIIRVLSISNFYCPDNCPPDPKPKKVVGKRAPENSKPNQTQEPHRIKIAPNPTKTVLNFEGKQLGDYSLHLFDTQGKEVLHLDHMSNPANLEKLAKGIYVYEIADQHGYKQTGKIVKE